MHSCLLLHNNDTICDLVFDHNLFQLLLSVGSLMFNWNPVWALAVSLALLAPLPGSGLGRAQVSSRGLF